MLMTINNKAGWALLTLLLVSPAQGFYIQDYQDTTIELRGFARGLVIANDYPNDPLLFTEEHAINGGVFGRLMLDARQSAFSIEVHAVQSILDKDLRASSNKSIAASSVERSDALDWRYANQRADFFIDRLNMQYAGDRLTVKVGRQPINLAASFYFTPNDFFAPFAAQTFFRTYKPGVDAARLDWQFNDDSQLSLITVLDYNPDFTQATGWQNTPDWGDTTFLARASTLVDTFQMAGIIATLDDDDIIGFDFQGELFSYFGFRGEGHLRFPDETYLKRDAKLALAVDHRWASSFTLRLEHFYQRSGARDEKDYQLSDILLNRGQLYLARNYTALGAGYEFNPLLTGDAVWLYNHQDTSSLLALYSTYSLSNESELAIGLNIPVGKQPENGQLQTEFGSFPLSLTAEYRLYF